MSLFSRGRIPVTAELHSQRPGRKGPVATTVGPRVGRASRNAFEVTLSVDGTGRCEARTGDSAIDAMLRAVATRALVDVDVDVDVKNDGLASNPSHHAAGDVGAAAGAALLAATGHVGAKGALGLRGGGHAAVAHGSAFVIVGLELADRSTYIVHDARVVDASNVITTPTFFFFDAFVREARLSVHMLVVSGSTEDVLAAAAKGFAAALRDAVREV